MPTGGSRSVDAGAMTAALGKTAVTHAAPVNEFKEGWRPLAACAVGIGLGLSPLPTFTASVFAFELQRQFGWPRGAILAASMFVIIALIFLGPTVGRLTDRVGARPVAIVSTIALGLTTAAMALATHNIWTFYALYALMAFTSVGTLPVVYGKIVSLWFDRQRGLALGIALCTTGLSGMILPTYTQALIDHFGWRQAYIGLGLLPLLIALPMLTLLLPRRQAPASAFDAAGEALVLEGTEVKPALRDRRFWLMAFAAWAAGIGLGGVVFNYVPLLVDRGFTAAQAAGMFGIYGLSVVIGRLISGWLLDRFWAPAVGAVFMIIPAVGALLLAGGASASTLVVVASIMLGMASGAEFDLCAYLTSRYFGRKNFATLYAIQYACFGVGSGTAPAIFGTVRDVTGSYNSALYAGAALFVVAGIAMLLLGRYPKFARA